MGKYEVNDPDRIAADYFTGQCVWHPEIDHPDPWHYLDRERGRSALRWWRGDFYRWASGRYIRLGEGEQKRHIVQILLNDKSMRFLDRRPPEDYPRVTTSLMNDVLLCLSGMEEVYLPESVELNSWIAGDDKGRAISFANGLLYLDGKSDAKKAPDPFSDESGKPELGEHEPHYFTLTRMPYDYDPQAACPRWEAFLEDVMDGDEQRIMLLREWAGYLLSDSLKRQKFLLMAGEGSNGKTVFATILEKMLGEENVSHVPLCRFGDRFALASTLGKLLNSTSESSQSLDEAAEVMLKSFTSGDRITFERKYREPLHARPTAKVMISTNSLPHFKDKSSGIWRRLLYVPFERCYEGEAVNPDLIDELSGELPGIFNWALEGLRMLEADGSFVEPRKCLAAAEQYRRDVNPARTFLLENYAESLPFDDDGVPTKEVYDAYAAYCYDNGCKAMNNANFGKEVKRAFPRSRRIQGRRDGERVPLYTGLAAIGVSEFAG